MNRNTLDTICEFGGLTALCLSDKTHLNLSWVKELASSLSAEKPSLIIDLSNYFLITDSFFDYNYPSDKNCHCLKIQLSKEPSHISNDFLDNLIQRIVLKQVDFPEILLIIPLDKFHLFNTILLNCSTICFFQNSKEDSDLIEKKISFIKNLKGNKIWISNHKISNKLKKDFFVINSFEKTNSKFINLLKQSIVNLRKIQILKKNSLSGLPKLLLKIFPILMIIILICGFFLPRPIESLKSSLRDMKYDRKLLSSTPYFEYTFNGNESLNRLSRYAIGKFHATVTNKAMIDSYINEILKKNDFQDKILKKNGVYYPKEGTSLRFYPSDSIDIPKETFQKAAWQYFTSMMSDSIAYITEFYNDSPSENSRLHKGIDVASSKGTRIFAPFTAKAWTFQDERGGTILGLVNKNSVILFMHCDQLLYLNGQSVMVGDPIATIGMTGHTTGPHAHIVTGVISSQGDKMIGGVRYKVIDPFKWHQQLKIETK